MGREMSNLLDKFSKVKVNAAARISPEDAERCDKEQALYDRAYTLYTKFRAELAEGISFEKQATGEHRLYCVEYGNGGLDDTDKRIYDIQMSFVSRITYVFTNKYNVDINLSDIEKTLGITQYNKYHISKEAHIKSTRKLCYNEILDEILLQLGGLSFADKAVQQIKDNAKKGAHNYYTVNKKIIQFGESFARWDKNYHPVLLALWHFKTGTTSMAGSWWQRKFQKSYSYYNDDERVGSPFEFEDGNIRKMRYFKNGRWDITFASAELADTFAREYLGY